MIKSAGAILFWFLSPLILFGQASYPKNYFVPPLDGPLQVIGSFGEIRQDHFHSGLDLSTNEQEGKKVYASAAGYISRIKIAPDGFGKAIYITHPNGYVTVYAHLKRYNPVIEKYIRRIQYAKESFVVDQYPEANELPVKKGEVIAWSGSTGGAEGPHLHFEIRDAKTEWPVNPLLFGFKIPDTVPPRISRVKIYSLHRDGVVINSFESASYKVAEEQGINKILGPEVLTVFGSIGLGVEAEDKMTGASKNYNLGIYSVEMKFDGKRAYYFCFDKFAFDETRYANAHIDYEEEVLHDFKIQRCYRLPGNKLSVDANADLPGEIIFNDAAVHYAEFIVKDFAGNSSTVRLDFQSKPELGNLSPPSPPEDASVISDVKGININTSDLRLQIPAGAVYDKTWFTFSKSEGSKNSVSSLHHVGEKTDAVHNAYTIEIKPSGEIPSSVLKKTAIVSYGKNGTLKYEGGEWLANAAGGFVTASVRHFGDFEVMVDTIPPTIKALKMPVSPGSQASLEIELHVKDNLSGIESYRATIDGKFFLLEFDLKTGLLTGEIPNSKTGKKHKFDLVVSDKKGNSTAFSAELIY